MEVKIKDFISKYAPIIFLMIFYMVFHIALSPGYWDDANYRRDLGGSISNLLPFLYTGYRLQTSRTTIELVIGILSLLPYAVWKILDLLIILLLYKDMEWFLEYIFDVNDSKSKWGLAFLLCSLPFSIMACAGWLATTTNYLWVISLGWHALNKVLKNIILEEKLSVTEQILTILAVLYSGCFESVAALMLVGMVSAIIYMRYAKHKKVPVYLWIVFFMIVLLFIEILICPGNKNRMESDAGYWMTDYAQMNLLDKLRMGIVTAFMHFVSIPSPVFFMISGFGAVIAFLKKGTWIQKEVALFPLVLDVLWTCYFMINYLIGKKVMTYQVPNSLLTRGIDTIEQILLLLTVAIWFASILYSFYWILDDRKDFFLCLTVLLVGCVPEIIVGMSSTVVNSMLRTVIYLYLSMIVLILCLWKAAREFGKESKWLRIIIYIMLIFGGLLNAIQMTRHILIYG